MALYSYIKRQKLHPSVTQTKEEQNGSGTVKMFDQGDDLEPNTYSTNVRTSHSDNTIGNMEENDFVIEDNTYPSLNQTNSTNINRNRQGSTNTEDVNFSSLSANNLKQSKCVAANENYVSLRKDFQLDTDDECLSSTVATKSTNEDPAKSLSFNDRSELHTDIVIVSSSETKVKGTSNNNCVRTVEEPCNDITVNQTCYTGANTEEFDEGAPHSHIASDDILKNARSINKHLDVISPLKSLRSGHSSTEKCEMSSADGQNHIQANETVKSPVINDRPTTGQSRVLKRRRRRQDSDLSTRVCYRCVFEGCSFEADDRSQGRYHLFRHFDYSPYCCKYCQARTKHSSDVLKHVKYVHRGKVCVYMYDRDEKTETLIENNLEAGKVIRQREMRYKCQHCRYKAIYPSEIKIHWAGKHPNKPFVTVRLQKSSPADDTPRTIIKGCLPTKSDTKRQGRKKKQPQTCSSDSHSSNLTEDSSNIKPDMIKSEHEDEIHRLKNISPAKKNNEKIRHRCPFEQCLYSASNRTLLRRHLYKHIHYKPFCCLYCSATASKQNNIESHVCVVHKGAPLKFKHIRDRKMEQELNDLLNSSRATCFSSNTERRMESEKESVMGKTTQGIRQIRSMMYKCSLCDFRSARQGVMLHLQQQHPGERQLVMRIIDECREPSADKHDGISMVTSSSHDDGRLLASRQNTSNYTELQHKAGEEPEKLSSNVNINSSVMKGSDRCGSKMATVNHFGNAEIHSRKDISVDSASVIVKHELTASKVKTRSNEQASAPVRVFRCQYGECTFVSIYKHIVRFHLFRHLDYRPFTCMYCQYTTTQHSSLWKHLNTVHPNLSRDYHYAKHDGMEQKVATLFEVAWQIRSKDGVAIPDSNSRSLLSGKATDNNLTSYPILSSHLQNSLAKDHNTVILKPSIIPSCNQKCNDSQTSDPHHSKRKYVSSSKKEPIFHCELCDYNVFFRWQLRHHMKLKHGTDDKVHATKRLNFDSNVLNSRSDDVVVKSEMKLIWPSTNTEDSDFSVKKVHQDMAWKKTESSFLSLVSVTNDDTIADVALTINTGVVQPTETATSCHTVITNRDCSQDDREFLDSNDELRHSKSYLRKNIECKQLAFSANSKNKCIVLSTTHVVENRDCKGEEQFFGRKDSGINQSTDLECVNGSSQVGRLQNAQRMFPTSKHGGTSYLSFLENDCQLMKTENLERIVDSKQTIASSPLPSKRNRQTVPEALPNIKLENYPNQTTLQNTNKGIDFKYAFMKPSSANTKLSGSLERKMFQRDREDRWNFKCPLRECYFHSRGRKAMRFHLHKHLNYRPFRCPICSHCAKQPYNFPLHMRSIHGNSALRYQYWKQPRVEELVTELLKDSCIRHYIDKRLDAGPKPAFKQVSERDERTCRLVYRDPVLNDAAISGTRMCDSRFRQSFLPEQTEPLDLTIRKRSLSKIKNCGHVVLRGCARMDSISDEYLDKERSYIITVSDEERSGKDSIGDSGYVANCFDVRYRDFVCAQSLTRNSETETHENSFILKTDDNGEQNHAMTLNSGMTRCRESLCDFTPAARLPMQYPTIDSTERRFDAGIGECWSAATGYLENPTVGYTCSRDADYNTPLSSAEYVTRPPDTEYTLPTNVGGITSQPHDNCIISDNVNLSSPTFEDCAIHQSRVPFENCSDVGISKTRQSCNRDKDLKEMAQVHNNLPLFKCGYCRFTSPLCRSIWVHSKRDHPGYTVSISVPDNTSAGISPVSLELCDIMKMSLQEFQSELKMYGVTCLDTLQLSPAEFMSIIENFGRHAVIVDDDRILERIEEASSLVTVQARLTVDS